MIRRIATVGGLTLVSRLSGFVRDVVMAAVLGAGPMADAFFIAFRLPNHFRAIFAEGAFAAAFVPAYARTLEQAGLPAAKLFADQIAAALIAINLVLLAVAMIFTPEVVSLLAPGLDPTRFDLAVALTRITFPYLALVSLETLFAGILNANNRFAAAAGAPIFLNLSIIATLLLTPFFADAGHAAAWGVLAAGVVIVLMVGGDAETHGYGIRLRMPRLDEPTRRFLKALGPAIIGAGGVQLALFADTLIASYPSDRRAVGALLRRSHQPAADRRGRYRRRHRAAARDVAPACRRRRDGRGLGPGPRHSAGAAAHHSLRRRRHHHPRSHHARAVRARRLHHRRRGGGRGDARRLFDRAIALRAAAGASPRRSMPAAIPPRRSRRRCSPPRSISC